MQYMERSMQQASAFQQLLSSKVAQQQGSGGLISTASAATAGIPVLSKTSAASLFDASQEQPSSSSASSVDTMSTSTAPPEVTRLPSISMLYQAQQTAEPLSASIQINQTLQQQSPQPRSSRQSPSQQTTEAPFWQQLHTGERLHAVPAATLMRPYAISLPATAAASAEVSSSSSAVSSSDAMLRSLANVLPSPTGPVTPIDYSGGSSAVHSDAVQSTTAAAAQQQQPQPVSSASFSAAPAMSTRSHDSTLPPRQTRRNTQQRQRIIIEEDDDAMIEEEEEDDNSPRTASSSGSSSTAQQQQSGFHAVNGHARFIPEDDQKIIDAVNNPRYTDAQGKIKWSMIGRELFGDGSRKAQNRVRQRYLRHLNPTLSHAAWSPEEDRRLIELYKKHNNSWTTIARAFNNTRSDLQCRERYYALCRKGDAKLSASSGSSAAAASAASAAESSSPVPVAPTVVVTAPAAASSDRSYNPIPLPAPIPIKHLKRKRWDEEQLRQKEETSSSSSSGEEEEEEETEAKRPRREEPTTPSTPAGPVLLPLDEEQLLYESSSDQDAITVKVKFVDSKVGATSSSVAMVSVPLNTTALGVEHPWECFFALLQKSFPDITPSSRINPSRTHMHYIGIDGQISPVKNADDWRIILGQWRELDEAGRRTLEQSTRPRLILTT